VKRILICGDRNWTDRVMIWDALVDAGADVIVIEGEASGADTIAREIAYEMDMQVLPYPAEWKRYGKAAGPIRNRRMLEEGKPDEVWAFHDDLGRSRGTRNMIAQARQAGVPVKVFSLRPPKVYRADKVAT
jgi:hypothetical protein